VKNLAVEDQVSRTREVSSLSSFICLFFILSSLCNASYHKSAYYVFFKITSVLSFYIYKHALRLKAQEGMSKSDDNYSTGEMVSVLVLCFFFNT